MKELKVTPLDDADFQNQSIDQDYKSFLAEPDTYKITISSPDKKEHSIETKKLWFLIEVLKNEIENGATELTYFREFLRFEVDDIFYNDKGELIYIPKYDTKFIFYDDEKKRNLANIIKNKVIKQALVFIKKGSLICKKGDYYYNFYFSDEAKQKMSKSFNEVMDGILYLKSKNLKAKNEELLKELESLKREAKAKKKHTKMGIHTMSQFFGDNKNLTLFSEDKIDAFKDATGLNLTNRPANYGVILNQAQKKVFEGILRAFTDTNYLGDEQKDKKTALKEIYSDTPTSALTLVKKENAPYKNIEAIPVLKLTQAQIIELSGYDLKGQRQGDKQDVIEALSFLAINQFCFYWVRLKTENGKPVKDKKGDYVKEEVMEVGTLLRIKTVRDQTGLLQYYEIQPSAPLLDQVHNYFLLVPNNWREEVKQLTGIRASKFTYEFLLWLRLQFEQIRRYNSNNTKRKGKDFKLSKSWEDVAIALKMPESMYKRNKPRSYKIIQDAYSVAIKLGYLLKVENNGVTDILYLNEGYYPKPGELV